MSSALAACNVGTAGDNDAGMAGRATEMVAVTLLRPSSKLSALVALLQLLVTPSDTWLPGDEAFDAGPVPPLDPSPLALPVDDDDDGDDDAEEEAKPAGKASDTTATVVLRMGEATRWS